MQPSFFDIQSAESRWMWAVTALLFLVYFGAFYLLALGLSAVFDPNAPHPAARALWMAMAVSGGLLAVQVWFADRHGTRIILESLSVGPCPRCGIHLERVPYEGLPVDRCLACGGVLAAEARVKRILGRREQEFSREFRKEAEAWLERNYIVPGGPRSSRPEELADPCACPSCRAPMHRRYYSPQYFVPVDRCFGCRLVWFDHKELELLQALVEERQITSDPRPVSWQS